MPTKLTVADARQSLYAHAAAKGADIYEKYGPGIGWKELQQILRDPACVRYPCEICFDATELQEGEVAYPAPKGDVPEEGFTLYVHPCFSSEPDQVPLLALYQLVLVNYGSCATPDDAEIFGASALGLTRDEYYRRICKMADRLLPEGSFP